MSAWPPTFILKEELIQYSYNLILFLRNLSKIIPSQKTADIILQMVKSLDFLYTSKGKETPKIDANSSNQRNKN